MDIGPDSLKSFEAALKDCVTIIWNGPMGVFEMEAFSKGTFGIAETLAELTEKVGRGCCGLVVEGLLGLINPFETLSLAKLVRANVAELSNV